MIALVAAPVVIDTSPIDAPSAPDWFAGVTVLARHFAHRGLLDAIGQQVHLARGRAGHYNAIDFVALLLGYAVSGERTLKAFFDRLTPFARPFMALFGRDRLPHRSPLSRFLAAVDAPCLAALRRLFERDLGQHGSARDQLGGLVDRHGHRLLFFDVDGTRQAARQRALVSGDDRPAPRRRMSRACAPGYTGRQRGAVVRVRTTVLQAHTQEWLGTFSGVGNGDYIAELDAACQVVVAYLQAKGVDRSQAVLRLDGLYGNAGVLARVQQAGLGFLARGRDDRLLDHPAVQARLQQPCDLVLTHPETTVAREVFDVGTVADWVEPIPGLRFTCRVVVTRRAAAAMPDGPTIGKRLDGQVYEVFLTSTAMARLTAADVLGLYHQRGGFEQVLSDEDTEQEMDRWCSRTPLGQDCWQVLSQWVWNTRLELGQVCQALPVRWTRWSDSQPVAPPAPQPVVAAPEPPAAEEVVAVYGPPGWAQTWGRAPGRFSSQEFTVEDNDTLRCPAGHLLRLRERRPLANGDRRVLYSARERDCRTCPLAPQCLGRGASGMTPRRVSALQRLVGRYARATSAPEPTPAAGDLLVGDRPGRQVRRTFVRHLRSQRVTLVAPAGSATGIAAVAEPPVRTREERAHRRLSWATRVARNALVAVRPRWQVILFGILPRLAAYLGLPSRAAQ